MIKQDECNFGDVVEAPVSCTEESSADIPLIQLVRQEWNEIMELSKRQEAKWMDRLSFE